MLALLTEYNMCYAVSVTVGRLHMNDATADVSALVLQVVHLPVGAEWLLHCWAGRMALWV